MYRRSIYQAGGRQPATNGATVPRGCPLPAGPAAGRPRGWLADTAAARAALRTLLCERAHSSGDAREWLEAGVQQLVVDFLQASDDGSDGQSLSSGPPEQLAALLAATVAADVELSPQGLAAAAVHTVVESVAAAWQRLYVPQRTVAAALLLLLQLLRSMQQQQ